MGRICIGSNWRAEGSRPLPSRPPSPGKYEGLPPKFPLIGFVPDWYQPGTNVVLDCYQIGTNLVANLVPDWYQIGTRLVPAWYQTGTKLVPVWYQLGTSLVPDWYQSGTKLIPAQVELDLGECQPKSNWTWAVSSPRRVGQINCSVKSIVL